MPLSLWLLMLVGAVVTIELWPQRRDRTGDRCCRCAERLATTPEGLCRDCFADAAAW